jgi:hypothetical protein
MNFGGTEIGWGLAQLAVVSFFVITGYFKLEKAVLARAKDRFVEREEFQTHCDNEREAFLTHCRTERDYIDAEALQAKKDVKHELRDLIATFSSGLQKSVEDLKQSFGDYRKESSDDLSELQSTVAEVRQLVSDHILEHRVLEKVNNERAASHPPH